MRSGTFSRVFRRRAGAVQSWHIAIASTFAAPVALTSWITLGSGAHGRARRARRGAHPRRPHRYDHGVAPHAASFARAATVGRRLSLVALDRSAVCGLLVCDKIVVCIISVDILWTHLYARCARLRVSSTRTTRPRSLACPPVTAAGGRGTDTVTFGSWTAGRDGRGAALARRALAGVSDEPPRRPAARGLAARVLARPRRPRGATRADRTQSSSTGSRP